MPCPATLDETVAREKSESAGGDALCSTAESGAAENRQDEPKPKEYTENELAEYLRALHLDQKGAAATTDSSTRAVTEKTTETAKAAGVREESFHSGKWHRMLNAEGSCYLFVHNITRDVTAVSGDEK